MTKRQASRLRVSARLPRLRLLVPLLHAFLLLSLWGMAGTGARAQTVYDADNFDSYSAGAMPTGWTAQAGSWGVTTADPQSGTKTFGVSTGSVSTNYIATYSAMSATTDQCVIQKFTIHNNGQTGASNRMGPVLCWSSSTSFYNLSISFASPSFVSVIRNTTVATSLGSTGSGPSFADGDVIYIKFWRSGSTLAVKVWKVTASEPASATFSATDATPLPAGFGGLQVRFNGSVASPGVADDVYITSSSTQTPFLAGALSTAGVASNAVGLTWPAPASPNTGAPPYTYDVRRATDSSMSVNLVTLSSGQSGTTYTDGTAQPNTAYYYQVVYRDQVTTARTNALSVTTPVSSSPMTAYSVTVPSPPSGAVGYPSAAFALPANGVLAAGQTLVITATDDLGQSFTAASYTGTGVAPTTQTFTYTPGAPGVWTLTFSHSGTATGVSDPAPASYTALPVLKPLSAACRLSPFNWRGDGLAASPQTTGRMGSGTWVQAYAGGASASFNWITTGASPTASLIFDNTGITQTAYVALDVDGTFYSQVQVPTSPIGYLSLSGLAGAGAHRVTVWMQRPPASGGRWGGTNVIRLGGLMLDAQGSAVATATFSKWALFFGDSTTEGAFAGPTGLNDWLSDYSYYVAQGLAGLGIDTGMRAIGGGGLTVTGDADHTYPAVYAVTGGVYSQAASSWDKLDSSYTLLDSAGHLSAYGGTGQEPALILHNLGINDRLQTQSDIQASVVGLTTAERAAAPNAVILWYVPFNLYSTGIYAASGPATVATLKAAISQYRAAHPSDAKVVLADSAQAISDEMASAYMGGNGANSVHPGTQGQLFVAGRAAAQAAQSLTSGVSGGTKRRVQ